MASMPPFWRCWSWKSPIHEKMIFSCLLETKFWKKNTLVQHILKLLFWVSCYKESCKIEIFEILLSFCNCSADSSGPNWFWQWKKGTRGDKSLKNKWAKKGTCFRTISFARAVRDRFWWAEIKILEWPRKSVIFPEHRLLIPLINFFLST